MLGRVLKDKTLGKRGLGRSRKAFIRQACRDVFIQNFGGIKRAAGSRQLLI